MAISVLQFIKRRSANRVALIASGLSLAFSSLPANANILLLDQAETVITAELFPECKVEFSRNLFELPKADDDIFQGRFESAVEVTYNSIVDILVKDVRVTSDPAGGSLYAVQITGPNGQTIEASSARSSNQSLTLDPSFSTKIERLDFDASIKPGRAVPGTYSATVTLFCLHKYRK